MSKNDNVKEKVAMVDNLLHFDTMPDEYIDLLQQVKKDYEYLLKTNLSDNWIRNRENIMEKPDYETIFLMPGENGDYYWCNDPAPSNNCNVDDAIKYKREQPWLSVEEFQLEANEGECFIVYKGLVVMAYHNCNRRFLVSENGSVCYMVEFITKVRHIKYPDKPDL